MSNAAESPAVSSSELLEQIGDRTQALMHQMQRMEERMQASLQQHAEQSRGIDVDRVRQCVVEALQMQQQQQQGAAAVTPVPAGGPASESGPSSELRDAAATAHNPQNATAAEGTGEAIKADREPVAAVQAHRMANLARAGRNAEKMAEAAVRMEQAAMMAEELVEPMRLQRQFPNLPSIGHCHRGRLNDGQPHGLGVYR
eukprot:GHVU01229148.1.p1 GENE.GHVU01229148.1~~GHVU01229148.1.p1  ORF type:complete len:200 (+),score=44.84 GHVU01229148.1:215-814(+)